MENRIRFTKVRDVKSPTRANEGDAGIDFYVPVNLNEKDLRECNVRESFFGLTINDGIVQLINLPPHERIVIPSGIRVLMEPKYSALIAANKSGVATKKGLIFTAEVVDSPYVGEIHIAVVNTSNTPKEIKAGDKLMQFIHTPVYLTKPEEISYSEYLSEAEYWGTRGENWQGSSDNK